MPDEKPPETKITDRLFATYISPDRKVLDMDSFKAAMVKALSDAYEQGFAGWLGHEGNRTRRLNSLAADPAAAAF